MTKPDNFPGAQSEFDDLAAKLHLVFTSSRPQLLHGLIDAEIVICVICKTNQKIDAIRAKVKP